MTYAHSRYSILGGSTDTDDIDDDDEFAGKGFMAADRISVDNRIPTTVDTCDGGTLRFKHRLIASMTEFQRHGKPSAAYLATLRKPTNKDYDLLTQACLEAIISGENDVIVLFSYLMKFPADFPKGILEQKQGPDDVRRIKARKLLTWLHEHDHTDITVEALKQQRVAFTKIENFLEIKLDDQK